MNTVISIILRLVPLVTCSLSLKAAPFSAMHVFGDGVSATNEDLPDDPLFYGKRNCNGRVWVEVLWQWQGHAFDDAKNRSLFGNLSQDVVADTVSFLPSGTVVNELFVIWCANADFVDFVNAEGTNWAQFTNNSISRHAQAVTNLRNHGARTFVMPNAVDIMATPFFNDYAEKAFVRQRVIEFNIAFEIAMASLAANLAATTPGLTIHRPDAFTFFEQVLANPGAYGLVNPPPTKAAAYDVPGASMNGIGSNYIFWDDYHPTAKFQMHLAAFFKQLVFPVKVNSVSLSGGNVQMQLANIPMGRAGSIQGSTTLQPPWVQDLSISEPFVANGSTTKNYSFPSSGPRRFYRAGFPVVWTWP